MWHTKTQNQWLLKLKKNEMLNPLSESLKARLELVKSHDVQILNHQKTFPLLAIEIDGNVKTFQGEQTMKILNECNKIYFKYDIDEFDALLLAISDYVIND